MSLTLSMLLFLDVGSYSDKAGIILRKLSFGVIYVREVHSLSMVTNVILLFCHCRYNYGRSIRAMVREESVLEA